MRDHELKNEIGRLEDELQNVGNRLGEMVAKAHTDGAHGHEEFYEHVQGDVTAAIGHLVDAYSWLLNGAEDLGVEPLGDDDGKGTEPGAEEEEEKSMKELFQTHYPGGTEDHPDA